MSHFPVRGPSLNPPPRQLQSQDAPGKPHHEGSADSAGFPRQRPRGSEAGSQLHAALPQGPAGTSSHLQRQGDREDPKEEGHQPKAANEERSPSQALDDQALGQGQRETVVTPPLAAREGQSSLRCQCQLYFGLCPVNRKSGCDTLRLQHNHITHGGESLPGWGQEMEKE